MAKKKTTVKAESTEVATVVVLSEDQVRFLAELRNALGIVSKACEAANISRGTHYAWLKGLALPHTQAMYQKEIEDIKEMVDDVVENALLEKVLEGNESVLMFVARCRLRQRGYVQDYNNAAQNGIALNEDGSPARKTFTLQILPPKLDDQDIIDITPNQ